ncbi:MAG: hypothetical protein ACRD9R_01495 [Pyrinomonadaceae bacterium]
MQRTHRITPFVYGYSVGICLIAVVVCLMSLASFIEAVFNLSDPLHARDEYSFGYYAQPSLASFEAYRLDVVRGPSRESAGANRESPRPLTPQEEEALPRMYEAAKVDRIQTVRLQAYRSLTVSSLFILISAILFVTHWRWMRRVTRDELKQAVDHEG